MGETKFKLKFKDIKSIAKTKTFGIFDWAIMIKAQKTDSNDIASYLFGAFNNRDFAYKRMMDLWATHVVNVNHTLCNLDEDEDTKKFAESLGSPSFYKK